MWIYALGPSSSGPKSVHAFTHATAKQMSLVLQHAMQLWESS